MLIAVAAAKSAFTAPQEKCGRQHFGCSKPADSTRGAQKSPERENKAVYNAQRWWCGLRYLHKSAFKCHRDAFGWLKMLETKLSRWRPELKSPQDGLQHRCSFAACTDLQLDYAHVQHILHSHRVITVSTSKTSQESSNGSQCTSALCMQSHPVVLLIVRA